MPVPTQDRAEQMRRLVFSASMRLRKADTSEEVIAAIRAGQQVALD